MVKGAGKLAQEHAVHVGSNVVLGDIFGRGNWICARGDRALFPRELGTSSRKKLSGGPCLAFTKHVESGVATTLSMQLPCASSAETGIHNPCELSGFYWLCVCSAFKWYSVRLVLHSQIYLLCLRCLPLSRIIFLSYTECCLS